MASKRAKRASEIEGITRFGQRWEHYEQQLTVRDVEYPLAVDTCPQAEGWQVRDRRIECLCCHEHGGEPVDGEHLHFELCPHATGYRELREARRKGNRVICATCSPGYPVEQIGVRKR